MSAASARLYIAGHGMGVHRTPHAPDDAGHPGHAVIELGVTPSGLPVILTASSAEWLDDLESAVQVARARLIVQRAPAVTP